MVCKKCGSDSVNIQAVAKSKTKKGLFYWVFVGWWLEPFMWLFLTLPWLIIKIFKPKKHKTKTVSMAVCQDCGHSWKV